MRLWVSKGCERLPRVAWRRVMPLAIVAGGLIRRGCSTVGRMALLIAAAGALLVMGSPGLAQSAGGGNHFDVGYCTWAAADEAQRAWGVWIPWYGNAGDWAAGARDAGWQVSAVPRPESIAAMPRGVQGSGPDGHVAWVLSVSADGTTVTVRSQNWHGPGILTVHDLQVDGRVQFITPPGRDDASASTVVGIGEESPPDREHAALRDTKLP